MELPVLVEHQGIVLEPVGMIIHVVAIEEEGGVACMFYISMPDLLVCIVVFSDLKHDI